MLAGFREIQISSVFVKVVIVHISKDQVLVIRIGFDVHGIGVLFDLRHGGEWKRRAPRRGRVKIEGMRLPSQERNTKMTGVIGVDGI